MEVLPLTIIIARIRVVTQIYLLEILEEAFDISIVFIIITFQNIDTTPTYHPMSILLHNIRVENN